MAVRCGRQDEGWDAPRSEKRNAPPRRVTPRHASSRWPTSDPIAANLVRHGVNSWSIRTAGHTSDRHDIAPEARHPLSESPNMQRRWCLGERNTRRNAKSRDKARLFGGGIVESGTRRANRTGQYIERGIELRRLEGCAGFVRRAVGPSYLPDHDPSSRRRHADPGDPDPKRGSLGGANLRRWSTPVVYQLGTRRQPVDAACTKSLNRTPELGSDSSKTSGCHWTPTM